MQASESYKANLLKSKTADLDSSGGTAPVETHTDGVTSLMVAAVGGHMVRADASFDTLLNVNSIRTMHCTVWCRATIGHDLTPK